MKSGYIIKLAARKSTKRWYIMQSKPYLRRSSLLIVFSLVVVALLPSCIVVVDDDDDDDYYRRRWSLDVIVYGAVSEQPAGDKVYSLNLSNEATLSGNADCTGFEGTYTINDDNSIHVERLSRTSTSCSAASLANAYLEGLEEARTVSVNEDALIIQFGDNGNSMRFSPIE